MRDDLEFIGINSLAENKVVLPQKVIDSMRLHPDSYVEIYNYSGIGQMEFSGLSYVDDDYSIFIPDEIILKLGARDQCKFYIGREMAVIRLEVPETQDENKKEISTRQRFTTQGTVTMRTMPVEMRIYKHICDVVRYGTQNYVSHGTICALCGEPLTAKEGEQPAIDTAPKCVRCGHEVTDAFCGNCGLKLRRLEKVRKCKNCGGDLFYIDKYTRFYCYNCGRYERAVKPGVLHASCPDCGRMLSYVKRYDNWYCFSCKGYRQPYELIPEEIRKVCPNCHGHLTYMKEYNKYYCRKCAAYKSVVETKKDEQALKNGGEKKQ